MVGEGQLFGQSAAEGSEQLDPAESAPAAIVAWRGSSCLRSKPNGVISFESFACSPVVKEKDDSLSEWISI